MRVKKETYQKLVYALAKHGYPQEVADMLVPSLKSEKAVLRMVGYLYHSKRVSLEEIADEMVAIVEEHERWRKKKVAEVNNAKYNELLLRGIDE